MFGLGKRILSLSIEGTTIRVVTSRGDRVDTWHSIPFAPDYVINGPIANPDGLGRLLRSALDEQKVPNGQVVCAHSALGASLRILKLPRLNAVQLQAIVAREARRLANNAVGKYYIHWQALPPGVNQQRVFVLVVPRAPLHALKKTLQAAGLKPGVIDLKPMALMRAANRKNAIIANGENTTVDVTIVRNGLPMLIRSAFLGGDSGKTAHISGRVGQELLEALSAYDMSYRDRPLPPQTPVHLTGAVAGDESFRLNAAAAANRAVAQPQPPLRYPDDLPVSDYAVNLGLILRML